MAHVLDSVRLKVLRAEHHLRELEREVLGWDGRHPYAVVGQFDPESSYQVFRFRVFEPLHEEWGLLIGDCVHNARSALDHLACRLVELNGKRPNRATQFPIFTSCEDLVTKGKRMVAKLSPRHLDMFVQFQPYHAEDLSKIREHPLTVLSDLSNADKHRVMNATYGVPRTMGYTPLLARHCYIPDESDWIPNWGRLEDGGEVMRIKVVQTGPNPEVHLDQVVTIEISLGYNEPAVETLGRIVEHVWDIFEVVVSDFG